MGEEAPRGTAFAQWLERVRSDPQGIEPTRARIEDLMRDPTVAARVRDGLAARRSARQADTAAETAAETAAPDRLAAFLRGSDGGLTFRLRLGAPDLGLRG